MNKIAISIMVNEKRCVIAVTWPKMDTLKSLARLEIGRLKKRAQAVAFRVAMAIIPMPTMVAC